MHRHSTSVGKPVVREAKSIANKHNANDFKNKKLCCAPVITTDSTKNLSFKSIFKKHSALRSTEIIRRVLNNKSKASLRTGESYHSSQSHYTSLQGLSYGTSKIDLSMQKNSSIIHDLLPIKEYSTYETKSTQNERKIKKINIHTIRKPYEPLKDNPRYENERLNLSGKFGNRVEKANSPLLSIITLMTTVSGSTDSTVTGRNRLVQPPARICVVPNQFRSESFNKILPYVSVKKTQPSSNLSLELVSQRLGDKNNNEKSNKVLRKEKKINRSFLGILLAKNRLKSESSGYSKVPDTDFDIQQIRKVLHMQSCESITLFPTLKVNKHLAILATPLPSFLLFEPTIHY